MTDRITVHNQGNPIYDIVFQRDFSEIAEELRTMGLEQRKICVVTDSTVAS